MWTQDRVHFLRAIEHAFLDFGGVPEVLRHDNLKAAIVRACPCDPSFSTGVATASWLPLYLLFEYNLYFCVLIRIAHFIVLGGMITALQVRHRYLSNNMSLCLQVHVG